MISIDSVTYIYPKSRKMPSRLALDRLSLTIPKGSFSILSGPNGSGKSTLFRILTGLARPSEGTISIDGHDLLKEPKILRQKIATVFQSPALDKYLTIIENLKLQATLYHLSDHVFSQRLEQSLNGSPLKDRLNDRVITLSGGLARQVELVKALLPNPEILLLDEPTTGLDPASRRDFLAQLLDLQRQTKMTVLMTSHIFSEAEDADHVAILKEGRLLAFDTPKNLRALLKKEMLIIHSRDPYLLMKKIDQDLSLSSQFFNDEIRLEETDSGNSLPLLDKILSHYRSDIISIAIRQPTLEDVFIHLTKTSSPEHVKEFLS